MTLHGFGRAAGAALIWFAAGSAGATTLSGFEAYLAFGDSLSDKGNLAKIAPELVPDPPYFKGRRSNGPVWPEAVAALFEARGLPTGNYAFGFANATPTGPVPDLPEQVAMFAGDAASFAKRNTAATIWAGSNDILSTVGNPDTGGAFDPVLVGQAAAASVVASAAELGALGVDHVAIFNLADFSTVPRYTTALPQLADAVGAGSAAFNAALTALLPGLQASGLSVQEIDINAFFADLLVNPATYGVKDATIPCFFAFNPPPGGPSCDNPDDLAFYDDIHPNRVIHAQIGEIVSEAGIAPVPLPATGALLIVAGGLLAAVRYQRSIRRPA